LFQKSRNKDGLKIDYKTILTNQEQNIFELMHQKNRNKNIAAILFISVSTVKTHINNIYTKLDISSRKEIDQYF
jgi:DNA-binding CsgD family transcriptional regulator